MILIENGILSTRLNIVKITGILRTLVLGRNSSGTERKRQKAKRKFHNTNS